MGKPAEDKGYFSKVCLCRLILGPTFCLLQVHKTPGERIYGSPHFSEVSAFNQIREVPRRLASASVDSQLPSAQNNPYTKVASFGVTYSNLLQWFKTATIYVGRDSMGQPSGPDSAGHAQAID